jgi:hypothetical protein
VHGDRPRDRGGHGLGVGRPDDDHDIGATALAEHPRRARDEGLASEDGQRFGASHSRRPAGREHDAPDSGLGARITH